LNALIPREVKVLEGSGDRRSYRSNRPKGLQRDLGEEAAVFGRNPKAAVELRSERATKRVVRFAK